MLALWSGRRGAGSPLAPRHVSQYGSLARKFTEPVALSSTQPTDLSLPRRALRLSFGLVALRARCDSERMEAGLWGQPCRSSIWCTLRPSYDRPQTGDPTSLSAAARSAAGCRRRLPGGAQRQVQPANLERARQLAGGTPRRRGRYERSATRSASWSSTFRLLRARHVPRSMRAHRGRVRGRGAQAMDLRSVAVGFRSPRRRRGSHRRASAGSRIGRTGATQASDCQPGPQRPRRAVRRPCRGQALARSRSGLQERAPRARSGRARTQPASRAVRRRSRRSSRSAAPSDPLLPAGASTDPPMTRNRLRRQMVSTSARCAMSSSTASLGLAND